MPLNYAILDKVGTTDSRLEEIFTSHVECVRGSDESEADFEKRKEKRELDNKVRIKIEGLLSDRLNDAIWRNMRSAHLYAAVDLAWDSSTITKQTLPLVLYAQKRINTEACVSALEDAKCADQYVKTSESGRQYVDLPKFTEVNINIVRSIITRRVAAQSARFTNLYPFFKYDSRGTKESDRLRCDILSQESDIMADWYGYREGQIQWIRDMLLYPHAVVFPACRWDRSVEWVDGAEGMDEAFSGGKLDPKMFRAQIKREGVPMICPHPSRVFYDTSHPIQSINSDSGCEWFGFWDVVRYRDIYDSNQYYSFNKKTIGYNENIHSVFSANAAYFSQYYTTINPPEFPRTAADANDRKANLGYYTSNQGDNSVFISHIYVKMVPNQHRMGEYPYPVWIHFVVANMQTVIAAEIMPDCPGFVFSYNESSQRLVNLSMAHEILPFQDQLTNLFSQLLETAKRDLFTVALLNLDAFPAENDQAQKALKQFREAMKSEDFYSATAILEVSIAKMRDLGVDMDSVFKVIRQDPNPQISVIFQTIVQTIMMAERVMAMSPQEQAQLSPRETSATEVQIIASTTENIYQFISDAIDSGRAAMKRYIYNARMSLGSRSISNLPVISRYRPEVAEELGLRVVDFEDQSSSGRQSRKLILSGSSTSLVGDYIFNSRDGADRASNIQSAQAMTQLLGVLMNPAVLQMLTKEKLSDIINAIIRQSGAGIDVFVEPNPGEENSPVVPPQMPQIAGATDNSSLELPTS